MLRFIPGLKYAYHDIKNEKKFLDLVASNYLKRYISQETKLVVIKIGIWATRLQKVGILNLFNIPHFEKSAYINAYIKMFLSFIYGGYLWIDM